jgi:hypothetical protein
VGGLGVEAVCDAFGWFGQAVRACELEDECLHEPALAGAGRDGGHG